MHGGALPGVAVRFSPIDWSSTCGSLETLPKPKISRLKPRLGR